MIKKLFLIIFVISIAIIFSCSYEDFNEIKDEPEIIKPADKTIIYDNNNPTFVWKTVNHAKYYYLKIDHIDGSELMKIKFDSDTIDNMKNKDGNVEYKLANTYKLPFLKNLTEAYSCSIIAGNEFQYYPTKINRFKIFNSGPIELISPANEMETCKNPPELKWKEIFGAQSYEVQISTNENFTENLKTITTGNTPSIVLSERLESNTQYYWKVKAKINNIDTEYCKSNTFKIIELSIPQNLIAQLDFETCDFTYHLSWSKIYGNNITYYIKVGTTATNSDILPETEVIDATSYTIQFSAEGTYYFSVKAKKTDGEECESQWSEPLDFIVGRIENKPYDIECAGVSYNIDEIPVRWVNQLIIRDSTTNKIASGDSITNPNISVFGVVRNPGCYIDFNGSAIIYMNGVEIEGRVLTTANTEYYSLEETKLTLPLGDGALNEVAIVIMQFNGRSHKPIARSDIFYIKSDFKTPAFQAQLIWNGKADLDLYVQSPDGTDCYYDNKLVNLKSGSLQLDYDNREAYGPENITLKGNPDAGKYKVYANYFAGFPFGNEIDVMAVIRVWKNGKLLSGECYDFTKDAIKSTKGFHENSWNFPMDIYLP